MAYGSYSRLGAALLAARRAASIIQQDQPEGLDASADLAWEFWLDGDLYDVETLDGLCGWERRRVRRYFAAVWNRAAA